MITPPEFPTALLEERTCYKCGLSFMADGRRSVCPNCRKPKTPVKRVDHLTLRDKQIAELASKGMQTKEIAWELKLTPGTVQVYLNVIFRKIGVRNRAELAGYWIRQQMASAASQEIA